MNVVSHSDPDFEDQLRRLLAPSSLFDPGIEKATQEIIDAVRARRDEAVAELTERFNGPKLDPDQFAVTQAECMAASVQADPALRQSIAETQRNVETFARKSLRKDWSMRNSHGATVGEKFDPLQRVGIYVPGGMAPLVSTVLMTVPLAKAAGCAEIVVCTPCDREGRVNPALVYAARTAGATEIYRIGGAQAIAAMALGTPTIPKVSKIFGPGNAYVVAAKRLLFGYVAVDLLPGPSELLVLADDSGDAACIASDLLAQGEHGSGHERVWLLTPSGKLLRAVEKEVARQLAKSGRGEFIKRALDRNGWLIQVSNLEQGIEIANQLAPEHLEIMTRRAPKVARQLTTAGAIFMGVYSPTVVGDYVAGPSHTLPAGGTGAAFAGLTVDQFQRRTSLISYNKAALKKAERTVAKFAELEGLEAHGKSMKIRLKK